MIQHINGAFVFAIVFQYQQHTAVRLYIVGNKSHAMMFARQNNARGRIVILIDIIFVMAYFCAGKDFRYRFIFFVLLPINR